MTRAVVAGQPPTSPSSAELDDVQRGRTVTGLRGGRHYLCGAGERHSVFPRSVSAQRPGQLGAVVEEELEGTLVGVRS